MAAEPCGAGGLCRDGWGADFPDGAGRLCGGLDWFGVIGRVPPGGGLRFGCEGGRFGVALGFIELGRVVGAGRFGGVDLGFGPCDLDGRPIPFAGGRFAGALFTGRPFPGGLGTGRFGGRFAGGLNPDPGRFVALHGGRPGTRGPSRGGI